MDHMLVFSYLVIVLLGTWSAFVTLQLYRTRGVPLLRHLFYYIICLNTVVLGYLIAKYAVTNLIGDDPSAYPNSLLVVTAAPIFAIYTGLSWTALRLAGALRRRAPVPRLGRVFVAVIALIGVSYAVGMTLLLRDGTRQWLLSTHSALGILTAVVNLAVFLSLAAGRLRHLTVIQKGSVRRFGWYFFCGYIALTGSEVLPQPVHLVISATALLWLNCVPIIWLRRGFRLYHQTSTKEEGTAISALAQKHGITQREQEVMELIVQGKSNKEIEEQLFISFSTVKNHAYNLYRKLDVSSRAQLIYLVMTAKPQSGGETIDANLSSHEFSKEPHGE
jgi:DNA-binding CsgD family transcriptional regulator